MNAEMAVASSTMKISIRNTEYYKRTPHTRTHTQPQAYSQTYTYTEAAKCLK